MTTESTTEETQQPAPPPPLPEKSKSSRTLTFPVPHVLKSLTRDESGFTHRDVREGGPRQIEFETVTEFSDAPVDESDQVLVIRATNQLNFAGSVIDVINDAVSLPEFQLVPTSPTATEYMAKVGERVMVGFVCRRDPQLSEQQGKDIFRIARIFVTLP